jgi:hypothetical protein
MEGQLGKVTCIIPAKLTYLPIAVCRSEACSATVITWHLV